MFREPQSCSASAFPYFEADAEIGVYPIHVGCLGCSGGLQI